MKNCHQHSCGSQNLMSSWGWGKKIFEIILRTWIFKYFGSKTCLFFLLINWIHSFFFKSQQRYRIFFSWKRLCPLTHSNLENFVFFFSEGCIFFSESIFELFSPKMSKLVKIPTSTQNSGAGKKNTARKKKIHHFHSLTRFWAKMTRK